MRKEIPPKVYKQINKIQSEARKTYLILADAFHLFEQIQDIPKESLTHDDFIVFKQTSQTIILQWKEFTLQIKTLLKLSSQWIIKGDNLHHGLSFQQIDPLEKFFEELDDENDKDDNDLYHGLF